MSVQVITVYLYVLLAIIFFISLAVGKHADTTINDDADDEPSLNVTELDCRFRRLALRYARQLQPWHDNESEKNSGSVFQLVNDALQLNTGSLSPCGESDQNDDATTESVRLPPETAGRESGDHGPINSWDRQPFLTDILEDASQGVDNDDGSSWFHVHHNVFYNANGFKMDYGGHDSIFEDNLVVVYPNKGLCGGFGSFYAGHEHVVRRNICIAANSKQGMIQLDECRGSTAVLHDNRYYAPKGVATVQCGWKDDPIPFLTFQESYGLEQNSTLQSTPEEVKVVVTWALEVLFPIPLKGTVLLDVTSVS